MDHHFGNNWTGILTVVNVSLLINYECCLGLNYDRKRFNLRLDLTKKSLKIILKNECIGYKNINLTCINAPSPPTA